MGYIYLLYGEHPEEFISKLDKEKYIIFDPNENSRKNTAEFIRLILWSEKCWVEHANSDGTIGIAQKFEVAREHHIVYVMRKRTTDEKMDAWYASHKDTRLIVFNEEWKTQTQMYAHRTTYPTGHVQVVLDKMKYVPGRVYGMFRVERREEEDDESLLQRMKDPTSYEL